MKDREWRGNTQKEFTAWPLKQGVRVSFLDRLRSLQEGERDVQGAKWFANIDAAVVQIKISGYRLVAYCGYEDCVYVLNAFKKDAAKGKKTRQHEIDLIKQRLRDLHSERGKPMSKLH
jgi:phage-related protein